MKKEAHGSTPFANCRCHALWNEIGSAFNAALARLLLAALLLELDDCAGAELEPALPRHRPG